MKSYVDPFFNFQVPTFKAKLVIDKVPEVSERTLPITDHDPVVADTALGRIVSLNIWGPGTRMASASLKMSEAQVVRLDPTYEQERIKVMAQYLFDMATKGSVQAFALQEMPLGALFKQQLNLELAALCNQYNAKNKGKPVDLQFTVVTQTEDKSTVGTCMLYNANAVKVTPSFGYPQVSRHSSYKIESLVAMGPAVEFTLTNIHGNYNDTTGVATLVQQRVTAGEMVCGDLNIPKDNLWVSDLKELNTNGKAAGHSKTQAGQLNTVDGFYDGYTNGYETKKKLLATAPLTFSPSLASSASTAFTAGPVAPTTTAATTPSGLSATSTSVTSPLPSLTPSAPFLSTPSAPSPMPFTPSAPPLTPSTPLTTLASPTPSPAPLSPLTSPTSFGLSATGFTPASTTPTASTISTASTSPVVSAPVAPIPMPMPADRDDELDAARDELDAAKKNLESAFIAQKYQDVFDEVKQSYKDVVKPNKHELSRDEKARKDRLQKAFSDAQEELREIESDAAKIDGGAVTEAERELSDAGAALRAAQRRYRDEFANADRVVNHAQGILDDAKADLMQLQARITQADLPAQIAAAERALDAAEDELESARKLVTEGESEYKKLKAKVDLAVFEVKKLEDELTAKQDEIKKYVKTLPSGTDLQLDFTYQALKQDETVLVGKIGKVRAVQRNRESERDDYAKITMAGYQMSVQLAEDDVTEQEKRLKWLSRQVEMNEQKITDQTAHVQKAKDNLARLQRDSDERKDEAAKPLRKAVRAVNDAQDALLSARGDLKTAYDTAQADMARSEEYKTAKQKVDNALNEYESFTKEITLRAEKRPDKLSERLVEKANAFVVALKAWDAVLSGKYPGNTRLPPHIAKTREELQRAVRALKAAAKYADPDRMKLILSTLKSKGSDDNYFGVHELRAQECVDLKAAYQDCIEALEDIVKQNKLETFYGRNVAYHSFNAPDGTDTVKNKEMQDKITELRNPPGAAIATTTAAAPVAAPLHLSIDSTKDDKLIPGLSSGQGYVTFESEHVHKKPDSVPAPGAPAPAALPPVDCVRYVAYQSTDGKTHLKSYDIPLIPKTGEQALLKFENKTGRQIELYPSAIAYAYEQVLAMTKGEKGKRINLRAVPSQEHYNALYYVAKLCKVQLGLCPGHLTPVTEPKSKGLFGATTPDPEAVVAEHIHKFLTPDKADMMHERGAQRDVMNAYTNKPGK